jgi:hypothetical protein
VCSLCRWAGSTGLRPLCVWAPGKGNTWPLPGNSGAYRAYIGQLS